MRDLACMLRLRYRRTEDGQTIIPGKRGFIYRHGPDRLGWALVYDYRQAEPTARWKEKAKRDPRLHVEVEGDEEAVLTFAPEDLPHIARRWCQAKFRRTPTPAQLAALRSSPRFGQAPRIAFISTRQSRRTPAREG